eukprot:TRINITY_DN4622_c0_g1_i1.p1 TRINITY_DN4622_c0_g1~~TRINITY_DN4622_c0_g1_i1.p1  ORF type:complete len:223 (-),score=74.82 TRINITY_DN4622_c0_g1_i1:33-701(-)
MDEYKKNGKKAVTYHDVTLYEEDVQLLEKPNWLNDNLISFYFEYLTFQVFEKEKNRFLFVHPSTVFMFQFLSTEEMKEIMNSLSFQDKEFIFLPINNNSNVERTGGSHWSLLLFESKTSTFFHFDSCQSINSSPATVIANQFGKLFSTKTKYQSINCPQQKNGHDCGIFLLAFSFILAQNISNGIHLERSLLKDQQEGIFYRVPLYVKSLRKQIKSIIEERK